MHFFTRALLFITVTRTAFSLSNFVPPYLTLPPTPSLPAALSSGYINTSADVSIWHAIFNQPLSTSLAANVPPIVFLHGAFANSDWLALQVQYLLTSPAAANATVISIDSRMQGRSTGYNSSISYAIMRKDVISLMDQLNIPQVRIVGWSDGAIIALNMAMNAPDRLHSAFAFGTSYLVNNSNNSNSAIGDESYERSHKEFLQIAPDPKKWGVSSNKVNNMLNIEPNYGQADFNKIPNLFGNCSAPVMWFVDGADEETINRGVPRKLHDYVPGSLELILPLVSHYAFLQDPVTFNMAIERFLTYTIDCSS